jgi:hypothetical protein
VKEISMCAGILMEGVDIPHQVGLGGLSVDARVAAVVAVVVEGQVYAESSHRRRHRRMRRFVDPESWARGRTGYHYACENEKTLRCVGEATVS